MSEYTDELNELEEAVMSDDPFVAMLRQERKRIAPDTKLTEKEETEIVIQNARFRYLQAQALMNAVFSPARGLLACNPLTHQPTAGMQAGDLRMHFKGETAAMMRDDLPDQLGWYDLLGFFHPFSVCEDETAFFFAKARPADPRTGAKEVKPMKAIKPKENFDDPEPTEEEIAWDELFREYERRYPDLLDQYVERAIKFNEITQRWEEKELKLWDRTWWELNAHYAEMGMKQSNKRFGDSYRRVRQPDGTMGKEYLEPHQRTRLGLTDFMMEEWLNLQQFIWNAQKAAKGLPQAEATELMAKAKAQVIKRVATYSKNDWIRWVEWNGYIWIIVLLFISRNKASKTNVAEELQKYMWSSGEMSGSFLLAGTDLAILEKVYRALRLQLDPDVLNLLDWKTATKTDVVGFVAADKLTWIRFMGMAHRIANGLSSRYYDPVTRTYADENFGNDPENPNVLQHAVGVTTQIYFQAYNTPYVKTSLRDTGCPEGLIPAQIGAPGSNENTNLENWMRAEFYRQMEPWVNRNQEHELFEPVKIGMVVGPKHEDVEKQWHSGTWIYQHKQQRLVTILAPGQVAYETVQLDEGNWDAVMENETLQRLVDRNLLASLNRADHANDRLLAELRRVCGPQNVAVIYGYNGEETGLAYAMQMADAALLTRMALETEIADMRGWKGPGDAIKYYAAFAQPPCQHGYNTTGKVLVAKGHGSFQNINVASCTNYAAGSHMCYGYIVGEWGSRGIKSEPDNWMWTDPDGDKHPMKFFRQYCQVMPPVAHQVLYRMLRIGELFHVMYRAPHTDGLKWELRARVWGLLRIGSLEDMIEVIKGLLKGRPMDRSFRTVQRGMSLTLPKWASKPNATEDEFEKGKTIEVTSDSRYPSQKTVLEAHEFDEKVEHAWAVEFWKVARQMYPWLKQVYKERGVDFDPDTFCRIVEWATDLADYQVTEGSLYPL